jgi:type I restriction enzyme S subunit
VAKGDYVINSRSDRRGSSGLSNYDGSVSLINIVLEPRRNFHGRFLHHLFRSHHFIEEFYKSGRGMVDDLWTTKYSVMKAIEFAFPPNIDEQEAIASFLDDRSEKLTSLVSALESKARMIKDLKVLLLAEGSLGRVQRS